MILLIDNYDSFTYNLYQMIAQYDNAVQVVRNDKITVAEIEKLKPDAIILSPGPGHPRDAGICMDVIKQFSGKIPIL
ncbi:MAG: aminodeoxychorismate/anthranilate synthase component II, partial [Gammaproteobacteria bacterium]